MPVVGLPEMFGKFPESFLIISLLNLLHQQACMLTFYPEFEASTEGRSEVIFMLDLSNSMKGENLKEAKKIALLALHHLPEEWVFNIVVFGTGRDV